MARGRRGGRSHQYPRVARVSELCREIVAESVERLDFYPGNFSARYGRVDGGVIEIGKGADAFINAAKGGRIWSREPGLRPPG